MFDPFNLLEGASATVAIGAAYIGVRRHGKAKENIDPGALAAANASAEAYKTRTAYLEDKVGHLETIVKSQGARIDLLTELATQRAAVEELTGKVDAYHKLVLDVLQHLPKG